MKKFLITLVFIITFANVAPFNISVNAASSDLKSSNYQASFVFYNDNTYYSNRFLNDKKLGIYKVGADMKSFKLIKEGYFGLIKTYKNSLLAYDDDKQYVVQLSLEGKLMKEFPALQEPVFEVYQDHMYSYNMEEQSFYQTSIKSGVKKFLINTKDTYVQEYTIHNGWLYYVHERYFDDYSENSVEHLSKIKLSNPSKEIKLVKNVNNIDTVIVRDGYIYAIVHKTAAMNGRNLYRMDYSGNNLTRISKQDMGSGPFISDKYIYFGENSFNDNLKLYRMSLNGGNVKVVANFNGRPTSVGASSNKNNMYFEVQNGINTTLKRISIK